ENGWLNLDLPDKECTARVKAKHVESTGNGDFYWHGEVISDTQIEEECKCLDGFLTLMRSSGELIGSAAVDGDYYEIMSIGGDKTLLARKETDGTALRCGQDEYERHTEASPAISTRSDENCTVRVLALFTANGG
ncbi:hypothetical protein RZS08_34460, partial [Arthrospira platensis SPKY1]|nr:hypothetical protein [Arthrospira platensis SPKY1]